jgi:ATP-dependent DNA helicase 2 subunit 1
VTSDEAPRATDEQIKKASNLLKRIDLKNFSAGQFANPGK